MIYYRIQVDHMYLSYRTWQNYAIARAEAIVWQQMHPDSEIRIVKIYCLDENIKFRTVHKI